MCIAFSILALPFALILYVVYSAIGLTIYAIVIAPTWALLIYFTMRMVINWIPEWVCCRPRRFQEKRVLKKEFYLEKMPIIAER